MKTIPIQILFLLILNTIVSAQTIDLLFAYPDDLEDASLFRTRIQTLIDESNEIYKNSGVSFTLNLKEIMPLSINREIAEQISGTFINCKDMEAFENTFPFNFWYKDSPHAHHIRAIVDKRKEISADFVAYIDYPNTGVSSAGQTGPRAAYIKIALPNLNTPTFVHELGHDMMLTHSEGACFPYTQESPSQKTVMSITCANQDLTGKADANNVGLLSGKNSKKNGITFYQECAWDAVAILNAEAENFANYGENIGNYPADNRRAPNIISIIEVTENCEAWVLAMDGLYKWEGYKWRYCTDNVSGAIDIEAKNCNKLYCVTADNRLYSYSLKKDEFKQLDTPVDVQKFAIGDKGTQYILDINGNIHYKDNSKWIQLNESSPLKFKDIDIQGDKQPWVIATDGTVYRWNFESKEWKLKTTIKAQRISAAYDGTILLIGPDNEIYIKSAGKSFEAIKADVPPNCNLKESDPRMNYDIFQNKATHISVYNKHHIWALSNERIFKYVGQNGFLEVYEMNNRITTSSH